MKRTTWVKHNCNNCMYAEDCGGKRKRPRHCWLFESVAIEYGEADDRRRFDYYAEFFKYIAENDGEEL